MEPQDTGLLQDTANIIAEVASDPGRLLLFAGPVALVMIVLIAIAILRMNTRRKEALEVSAFLSWESKPQTLVAIPQEATAADRSTDLEAKAGYADIAEIQNVDQGSWLRRLSDGLKKTRESLSGSLGALFSGKTRLTPELKEKLHEILYRADLGVSTATKLVGFIEQDANGEELDWDHVKGILKRRISQLLGAAQKSFNIPSESPFVVLIVGVNGVGKTTTVAKLAANFLAQEKSVLLCAADTYRAAAIDQLRVWGERLGIDVIAHQQGSDPAAVAYDAVKAAIARNVDVLIVDTAGRLHSKKELMDELSKINRVLGKDKAGAPHETLLVIDATTGQNALMQIKAFKEVVQLSGLIVTKLDGTAKGGVLIAAADQYGLPIHYVGIGEKASDLRPFVPEHYAESLL